MHTKQIKGNNYYYTTYRKNNEHKTVYLGTDEYLAKQKEEEIKAQEGAGYEVVEGPSRSRRFFVIFFVLLVCGLTFFFVKHEVTGNYFGTPYVGWVTGNVARDVADFTVADDLVKVALKQREEFKRTVRISNTGSKYLSMEINSNLGNLVKFSEPKFVLPIGYTKDVELVFYAPVNVEPGVYVGKINYNSESLQDSSFTIIEIESLKVLYDISINIPNQFRNIQQGNDLVSNVRLFNFDKQPVDVTVYYEVKDFNGDKVFESSEMMHIESEVSLTKTLTLPGRIKEGNYVLTAKVVNGESVGTSAALFDITNVNQESPSAFSFDVNDYMMIFILVLISLIFIVVVTTLLEYRRLRHLEFKEDIRRPIRYIQSPEPAKPQVVVVKKQSPIAALISAWSKRPKVRKVIIKEKGKSGISLLFKALAEKIKKKPKVVKPEPKIIVKYKELPQKVIVKHDRPEGITLFFRALAQKIKQRPKIKREVIVKPKIIFKHKKQSGVSLFFESLAKKIKEKPKIKKEIVVKYKEVMVKPKELPKPKEVKKVEKSKEEKLKLPSPEGKVSKPSMLKSFFSGFKSKHDAAIQEGLKTVSPLDVFKTKLDMPKHAPEKSKSLEFPHLKQPPVVVTRRQALQEGNRLAKASVKYMPKGGKMPKVVDDTPKKVYLSKNERDLAKQQELLKKKLNNLY
jgi:hypothetical protein